MDLSATISPPFHSTSVYAWQSRPQELGLERIVWTLDLTANPRLVGWSHGPFYYWTPPHSILNQEELPGTATAIQAGRRTGHDLSSSFDRSSFIRERLRRILSNYLIVDIYIKPGLFRVVWSPASFSNLFKELSIIWRQQSVYTPS